MREVAASIELQPIHRLREPVHIIESESPIVKEPVKSHESQETVTLSEPTTRRRDKKHKMNYVRKALKVGKKTGVIAKELGVTPQYVSIMKNEVRKEDVGHEQL